MTKQEPLWELIRSLTAAEKRFLRRETASTEAHYWRLYELIADMPVYDEARLQGALRLQRLHLNLSAAKGYLYRLLLRRLRSFHSEHSARIRAHELGIEATILLEKGLWQQAVKALRRMQQLAEDQHLVFFRLSALLQQRKIAWKYLPAATLVELQALYHQTLQQLRHEAEMTDLYEGVFVRLRFHNLARPDQPALLERLDHLQRELPAGIAPTFDATGYHLHLLSVQHQLEGDRPAALEAEARLLAHYEEHPELLKDFDVQERYVNIISNYFNNCYLLRKFDGVAGLLDRLGQLEPANEKVEALALYTRYYIELLYRIKCREYASLVPLGPEIERCLQVFHRHLPLNRVLAVRYSLALGYLLAHESHAALDSVNRLLEESAAGVDLKQIHRMAQVLQLALHFDLGHETLAENLATALLRKLRQENNKNNPGYLLARALRQSLRDGEPDRLIRLAETIEITPGFEEYGQWLHRKALEIRTG